MRETETLLVEIGTEELPPLHLEKQVMVFAEVLSKSLQQAGFSYTAVTPFVTPRRFAVKIAALSFVAPSRWIQKKGPPVAKGCQENGTPTAAGLGFAKTCGVSFDALGRLKTPEGEWLVWEYEEKEQSLPLLLPAMIEAALTAVPAQKRMRWGAEPFLFLRPIHWMVVLYGDQVLPLKVWQRSASRTTWGHRVHHPEGIVLSRSDHYESALVEGKVIANHTVRRQTIFAQAQALAEHYGGEAIIVPDLLEQVTGLVEWPVALMAHFEEAFLALPKEVLISAMQNHQKCFAIQNKEEKLLPLFIVISNVAADPPDKIVRGNERVMRARLSDAQFFYDQDRKRPLSARMESLKNVVFQKKLGTLSDKSERVALIAKQIAEEVGASPPLCERAGNLYKADLLTEMVFEFPELQGTMGKYYAREDKEPEAVCVAIEESYFPRFSKDRLPETEEGICLALADRLDTLVGIFGIGQQPTGEKDPFGLRRCALGILRILIEKQKLLDIEKLFSIAKQAYGDKLQADPVPSLVVFCFDRLRAWYQEQGVSGQTIEAVLNIGVTKPYDFSQRIAAITYFKTLPEASHLVSANKRVRNLLQKNQVPFSESALKIEPRYFKETAEQTLFDAVLALKKETQPLIAEGRYQEALVALATLQKPVDDFLDTVLVMAEEETLKTNRIHLLGQLQGLFMQVADVSKLAL